MVNLARSSKRSVQPVGTEAAPKGQRRTVNKARRVETLFATAKLLIEEGGGTDFTMQQLADRAGLSLATTYNLIGAKAAVLYGLLEQSLVELSSAQGRLPVHPFREQVPAMVRLAVQFFSTEPDFYRPLMRYLLGVYEPDKRPLFMARALAFWRYAVGGPAGAEGALADDLAQGLHLTFAGALDLWVHGEITEADFQRVLLRQAELLMIAIGRSEDLPRGRTSD